VANWPQTTESGPSTAGSNPPHRLGDGGALGPKHHAGGIGEVRPHRRLPLQRREDEGSALAREELDGELR
jgi:hypothetical protein